ncbi:uncharacterized protein LOC126903740 isoform X2 [Daktulosphaira vitifoliae]|uniref:uncharacterized protein LOC126903740 isoform X2 n=1 Tax=Daktulosphaira vitifoliae TaxID=58002 RepID=UPI0021A9B5F1|nr:uncharacterized protein LOC126903740 isoform X2 [Daktulosphaira vitifoliae]
MVQVIHLCFFAYIGISQFEHFCMSVSTEKPKNGSKVLFIDKPIPDSVAASQSQVNEIDHDYSGKLQRHKNSNYLPSSKDYNKGHYLGGGLHTNYYGPIGDGNFYYDDKPNDYYSPHYHGPPGDTYHEYHGPPTAPGGSGHSIFELDKQPLVVPLAGIALLGALAVLINNPLLLRLGPLRKRRDVTEDNGVLIAESIKKYLDMLNDKEKSNCWMCNVLASVYDDQSMCLERSVCEAMSRTSPEAEMDKEVLSNIAMNQLNTKR